MGFLKRLFGKKESNDTPQQEKDKATKPSSTSDNAKTPDPKERHRKYHVSLNKDENSENYKMWRVRLEHSNKTIKHFKTQEGAIEYAEDLADDSGASVVIHKMDGDIRKQNYKKQK